jgi:ATP-dependent protease ClpP protease subunit
MSEGSENCEADDCCVTTVGDHLYFYTDVSTRSVFRFATVFRTLEQQRPASITIHVNSSGGELHAGFALRDIVWMSRIPTVAIVEGVAASAATLLVLGCDRRMITRNSFMLLHQPTSAFEGTSQAWEHEGYNLKKMYRRMMHIYRRRTKLSATALRDCLQNERYWSARKCVRVGIVDSIATRAAV